MAWLPDPVVTALTYVAVAVGAIVVYETVRSIVKRALQKRLSRNLQQFLESPDLYRPSFKFTNKLVIQHQLLADPEINAKILEFAAREKQDIEAVREKVRGYIDEIVPSFNLLTVGAALSDLRDPAFGVVHVDGGMCREKQGPFRLRREELFVIVKRSGKLSQSCDVLLDLYRQIRPDDRRI